MSELLSPASFQDYLEQSFEIFFDQAHPETITLTEIKLLGGEAMGDIVSYSLLFHATHQDKYYPQGIYKLRHPGLGFLELFFTPLGPDDQGMLYEVVFS